MEDVRFTGAGAVAPEALAELRLVAMRPSLEAVGRFDPDRARARFLESYVPAETGLVWRGADLAGLWVLRRRPDHLYLDHLYIHPRHQGRGLGAAVLRRVQAEARAAGRPLRLMALRDSPANGFYLAGGFVPDGAEGVDRFYRWDPDPGA